MTRALVALSILLIACAAPAMRGSQAEVPRTVPASVGTLSGRAAPRPTARSGHSLVYDDRLRKVVLVDGYEPPYDEARRGELWSWDGARWEMLTDAGPPRRALSAAAFDSRRGRIISFGGNRGPGVMLGDTWEWNGRDWRAMTDTSPGARDHHAMAYDEARGRAVMFGGGRLLSAAVWPVETWTWDGASWTQAAAQGPIGRARTSMASDVARAQLVMFGGIGARPGPGQPQPLFDDTWSWNGASWSKLADGGPRGRYAHAMSFDRRAGVVLLYGGATMTEYFADMWQWDGRRWTEIAMTGPTPGKRYSPAMAYDSARGRTVLYGGYDVEARKSLDDIWEWDGTRWHEIRIATPP